MQPEVQPRCSRRCSRGAAEVRRGTTSAAETCSRAARGGRLVPPHRVRDLLEAAAPAALVPQRVLRAEQARVAVRNVRRDGMDQIKKAEKDSEISQDDAKLYSDEVQELTDKFIKLIDETLTTKEGEIRQV